MSEQVLKEKKRKKHEIDMLNGSLWPKILAYALPLAATGILQQLFNAADIAVVGNFVGADAMAAVGSNSAVVGLILNFFVGISLGTTVVIANAIGSGDDDEVSRAVHTSILVAIIGGICMSIAGIFLADNVVGILGVPSNVAGMAALYLKVYLGGMPAVLLYNFSSAIFRSQGNTRTPLIVLTISGFINVGLNLFFVIVLHRTVDGVALATVLSNAISAAILLGILMRTPSAAQLRLSKLRISTKTLARILKIGIPSGIQGMMFSFANIIIQSAINSLGSVVMAASSAAFNIEIFAYYVMNSFSQACTTFVGQNYGAGKEHRCHRALLRTLQLGILVTFVTCAVILLAGRPLLSIFNSDAEVIEIGYIRLKYILASYAFSIFQEVFTGYLRGYGVSLIPALCSVFGICVTRIIWISTVFRANPTFTTIMQVYPVSLGLTALLIVACALVFMKRRKEKVALALE